jgi:hypothetical protein
MHLRSPAKSTFKCLILYTLLWRGIMSMNLKNLEDEADCKKGMLNNQPQPTCVTTTVLLGSWGQQPLKDMTSLGTDFETHAYRQGYATESVAKELVARNTCTIASSKVRGTYWNRIKCKEHCGNPPEAVIGQATINLDSQVWKTHEDYLSTRLMCKHRYDARSPNGHLHQKPPAKSGNGKRTRYWVYYLGSTNLLLLEKKRDVCHKHGGAHMMYYLGVPKVWENKTRNWIPVQPRKVQRN